MSIFSDIVGLPFWEQEERHSLRKNEFSYFEMHIWEICDVNELYRSDGSRLDLRDINARTGPKTY